MPINLHREAVDDHTINTGHDNPDREWILSPYDTWERNPFYRGEPGPHPEHTAEEGDDRLNLQHPSEPILMIEAAGGILTTWGEIRDANPAEDAADWAEALSERGHTVTGGGAAPEVRFIRLRHILNDTDPRLCFEDVIPEPTGEIVCLGSFETAEGFQSVTATFREADTPHGFDFVVTGDCPDIAGEVQDGISEALTTCGAVDWRAE